MHKHPTLKSVEGFTLIEMLIVIAIIAILASVAIPQYSQYKIRGYDAQTKQALKNMHLLCNAYWLDTSALQGCDLPKIEEPTYGFNQNADVVAKPPPSPLDNFCASAKHNDSPNTFSIDSASLISSGSDCSGTGGSVQTASVSPAQTFATYNVTTAHEECERNTASGEFGYFAVVDSDGFNLIGGTHEDFVSGYECGIGQGGVACSRPMGLMPVRCDDLSQWKKGVQESAECGGNGVWVVDEEAHWGVGMHEVPCSVALEAGSAHVVFVGGGGSAFANVENQDIRWNMTYNFETGLWSNALGDKFKNGNRVE